MATIQEIITYADRKYPNQETDANKVLDLNDIHKNIFTKISRLKNAYEIYDTDTIADQLTYTLPSDCLINNVITILVSSTTEAISNSTVWNKCDFAGLNDSNEGGYFWGDGGGSVFSLAYNGLPLTLTGLSIRIFYYPEPAELLSSALSATPDLDEYYHSLLKYALIQDLASQGQNPDTSVADYWQYKYDEFMKEIEEDLNNKYNQNPTSNNQIKEVW